MESVLPHPATTTSADRALRVAETPADAVTMSSMEIAELTSKAHAHVMRDIRAMTDELGGQSSFGSTYRDAQGKSRACFKLPKRECLILVSGYSVELRARIIDRLEELERAPTAPTVDLSDPVAMRGYLLTYTEKVIALEATVEASKPKTLFYDSFVNADGLYGLQNAGRALGCHPNKFVGWLKQKYIFYQGSNLIPYTEYRQSGLFEVKVTVEGDRSFLRAFVTPKGLAYFASRVPADIKINSPHLVLVG